MTPLRTELPAGLSDLPTGGADPSETRGGRHPAPAAPMGVTFHTLAVRVALTLVGVLTMAGAGAIAIIVNLPSASAAKWAPLALTSDVGNSWWPQEETASPTPESAATPTEPKVEAPVAETPPSEATSDAHTEQSEASPSDAPRPSGITPDGKIILNLANEDELTRLPGVGKRRAEQIVALRERLGKFRKIRDLLRVKGIGPRSLKRLAPLVVLDPPPEVEEPR